MAIPMAESIVVLLLLMLILIILLILLAFKPWRFFFSSSRSRLIKVGDLERPLFSDDPDSVQNQNNELGRNYVSEGSHLQTEGSFGSPRARGLVCKQRLPSTDAHSTQGATLVLDVVSDLSEDVLVGQTLKRPLVSHRSIDEGKHAKKEDSKYGLSVISADSYHGSLPKAIRYQRSSLTLEVISGPSRGLRCSLQSTNTSRLPLTLGRVPPSEMLLNDSEISGKHAMINWNLNTLKWELVDMGSLNGTLLNSQAIHHADSGGRQWSEPIELANGDIITLGTSSRIFMLAGVDGGGGVANFQEWGLGKVQIAHAENQIPFGVGMASDPMALRRGGKRLPMEDMCYYQWPLPGAEQFGLFGICDGHGGVGAAKAASKMLPEMVANILSVSEKRQRVLSLCDASNVLRDAYSQTEASMNHSGALQHCFWFGLMAMKSSLYNVQMLEILLACIDGKQIKMTEDHRVTSQSERVRLKQTGQPLKDGETRLCGLNLARMLGDKFLKEQDSRFSSEPYISEVVHIDKASKAFVLMASDGLWDVMSIKKAVQLILQMKDRYAADKKNLTERIANLVLSEARNLRTKDNTSIIFLDFDTTTRTASCKMDS
ncbi:protein phosphatase 2C 70-like isoform X2 [Telopea speciosissima]|uniref:protein phosphatase 2C 70-like isoform X2 n=1 Tax=Telopea speciosissima TaxID=54955 RepID=UPI001CC67D87|nr:protein phosphatase 2C 70-like isoform X2 [Telopea speciosissima]